MAGRMTDQEYRCLSLPLSGRLRRLLIFAVLPIVARFDSRCSTTDDQINDNERKQQELIHQSTCS